MLLTDIQKLLPGHPWADRIQYFDTIGSTNNEAKRMALGGAPHGTVLIADHQTGGRGRMGRSFHSPAGKGLYLSVILRPQCPPQELMHLTCAAAVSACSAVEKAVGLRPGIKWTNDLVCGSRKLGGILTELVVLPEQCVAVVGIGINCCQQESDFPEEIRHMAGSLSMVTGKSIDRANLAAALIDGLYRMDETLLTGKSEMLHRYRRDCVTLGKDISILRADEVRYGHAVSIDDEGALVVRFPDGHTEAVSSGEVSIRGMYGYIP